MKISIFERSDINTADRNIRDKLRAAQAAHPEISDPYQALALQNVEKLEKGEAVHYEQNKLINAQRRELARLDDVVRSVNQELQDIERSKSESDSELDRVRSLVKKLQSGPDSIEIDKSKIRNLMQDVKSLRDKGMSPEQYEKLLTQVQELKTSQVDEKKLSELSAYIEKLQQGTKVDATEYRELLDRVKTAQTAAEKIQGSAEQQLQQLAKRQDEIEKIPDLQNQKIDSYRKSMFARYSPLEKEVKKVKDIPVNIEKLRTQINKEKQKLKTYRQSVTKRNQNTRERVDGLEIIVNDLVNDLELEKKVVDDNASTIRQLAKEFDKVILKSKEQKNKDLGFSGNYNDSQEIDPLTKDIIKRIKTYNPVRQFSRNEPQGDLFNAPRKGRMETEEEMLKRYEKQKEFYRKKYGSNPISTVSETYLNEIESLAENILGSELSKYLK